jgi:sporulation protein YtfJ
MENKHKLENLMRSTMENLRDMIDVNTVIGDTIETGDGNYIVPISKVSFGFASGGSEFGTLSKRDDVDGYPFGGGSGAGISVKPVAFLVIKGDNVRLLHMDYDTTVDRVIDYIPNFLESVKNLFKPNTDLPDTLNDNNL